MLWKRGAAAEGTPGTAGTPRAAGWPGKGEGGESSSPLLNLCAFLRKDPAGSSRAKACECHPVSAARGPRGGTARLGRGAPRECGPSVSPQCPRRTQQSRQQTPSLGCPPKRPAPRVMQQRHPSPAGVGGHGRGGTGGAPHLRDLCEEARMECPGAFCRRFCSRQGEGRARVWVHSEEDLRRSAPLLIILLWQLRFGSHRSAPHPGCSLPWKPFPSSCPDVAAHLSHTGLTSVTHKPAHPQHRGCAGPGWAGRGRWWHSDTRPLQPCHPRALALALAPSGSPENDPEQPSLGS